MHRKSIAAVFMALFVLLFCGCPTGNTHTLTIHFGVPSGVGQIYTPTDRTLTGEYTFYNVKETDTLEDLFKRVSDSDDYEPSSWDNWDLGDSGLNTRELSFKLSNGTWVFFWDKDSSGFQFRKNNFFSQQTLGLHTQIGDTVDIYPDYELKTTRKVLIIHKDQRGNEICTEYDVYTGSYLSDTIMASSADATTASSTGRVLNFKANYGARKNDNGVDIGDKAITDSTVSPELGPWLICNETSRYTKSKGKSEDYGYVDEKNSTGYYYTFNTSDYSTSGELRCGFKKVIQYGDTSTSRGYESDEKMSDRIFAPNELKIEENTILEAVYGTPKETVKLRYYNGDYTRQLTDTYNFNVGRKLFNPKGWTDNSTNDWSYDSTKGYGYQGSDGIIYNYKDKNGNTDGSTGIWTYLVCNESYVPETGEQIRSGDPILKSYWLIPFYTENGAIYINVVYYKMDESGNVTLENVSQKVAAGSKFPAPSNIGGLKNNLHSDVGYGFVNGPGPDYGKLWYFNQNASGKYEFYRVINPDGTPGNPLDTTFYDNSSMYRSGDTDVDASMDGMTFFPHYESKQITVTIEHERTGDLTASHTFKVDAGKALNANACCSDPELSKWDPEEASPGNWWNKDTDMGNYGYKADDGTYYDYKASSSAIYKFKKKGTDEIYYSNSIIREDITLYPVYTESYITLTIMHYETPDSESSAPVVKTYQIKAASQEIKKGKKNIVDDYLNNSEWRDKIINNWKVDQDSNYTLYLDDSLVYKEDSTLAKELRHGYRDLKDHSHRYFFDYNTTASWRYYDPVTNNPGNIVKNEDEFTKDTVIVPAYVSAGYAPVPTTFYSGSSFSGGAPLLNGGADIGNMNFVYVPMPNSSTDLILEGVRSLEGSESMTYLQNNTENWRNLWSTYDVYASYYIPIEKERIKYDNDPYMPTDPDSLYYEDLVDKFKDDSMLLMEDYGVMVGEVNVDQSFVAGLLYGKKIFPDVTGAGESILDEMNEYLKSSGIITDIDSEGYSFSVASTFWDSTDSSIEGGLSSFNRCGRPWENVNYYDAAAFCNLLTELYNKANGTSLVPFYKIDTKTFRNAKKMQNVISGGNTSTSNPLIKYPDDVFDAFNYNDTGFRLPSSSEWEYFAEVVTNESLLPEGDVAMDHFYPRGYSSGTILTDHKFKHAMSMPYQLSGVNLYTYAFGKNLRSDPSVVCANGGSSIGKISSLYQKKDASFRNGANLFNMQYLVGQWTNDISYNTGYTSGPMIVSSVLGGLYTQKLAGVGTGYDDYGICDAEPGSRYLQYVTIAGEGDRASTTGQGIGLRVCRTVKN